MTFKTEESTPSSSYMLIKLAVQCAHLPAIYELWEWSTN